LNITIPNLTFETPYWESQGNYLSCNLVDLM
jgi:hypothetical protein